MKKTILIIAFLCVGQLLMAQHTIPVSGGSVSNGYGSFSFSLGQFVSHSDFEPAITAHIVTASVVEGVQQPYSIDQLDIEGIPQLVVEIRLYPNPTAGEVTIVSSDPDSEISYMLYGINGVLLQRGTMKETIDLQLSQYASGTYILRLEDQMNRQNVYRIIKI